MAIPNISATTIQPPSPAEVLEAEVVGIAKADGAVGVVGYSTAGKAISHLAA